MCIPISYKPFSKIVKDNASSKSLASLGSIVKVKSLRISRRFLISSGLIDVSILLAKSSTSFGNSYGNPYSAKIA